MKKYLVLALGIATLLTSGLPAFAGAGSASPCAPDILKFCPGALSHQDRAACLTRHEDALSSGCSQLRDQQFQAACGADVASLCTKLQPAHSSLPFQVACLRKSPSTSLECMALIGKR